MSIRLTERAYELGAPWRDEGPSLIDLMRRASVSRLVEMTGGQMYLIEGDDRR